MNEPVNSSSQSRRSHNNNDHNPSQNNNDTTNNDATTKKCTINNTSPTNISSNQRRVVCWKCSRILCICAALPRQLLQLQHCHVIVLQHPQEAKTTKHSSLPIVQLCFTEDSITTIISRRFGTSTNTNSSSNNDNTNTTYNINSIYSIVKSKMIQIRRLRKQQSSKEGDEEEETVDITMINDEDDTITNSNNKHVDNDDQQEDYVVWLVYPSNESISLSKAMEDVCSNNDNGSSTDNASLTLNEVATPARTSLRGCQKPFIFVVFLDATWKYSREMNQSNKMHHQYPPNMQEIQLSQNDMIQFLNRSTSTKTSPNTATAADEDTAKETPTFTDTADSNKNIYNEKCSSKNCFIPRRFEMIRTPISDEHLSTAECIAHVVNRIEYTMRYHTNTNNHTYDEEEEESIFDSIMKPLDLMVQLNSDRKKRRLLQQQEQQYTTTTT